MCGFVQQHHTAHTNDDRRKHDTPTHTALTQHKHQHHLHCIGTPHSLHTHSFHRHTTPLADTEHATSDTTKNHNNTQQDTKCNRQMQPDEHRRRPTQTDTDRHRQTHTFHLTVLPRKSIIPKNHVKSIISVVLRVSVERSKYHDIESHGISLAPDLPQILVLSSHFAKSRRV